MSIERNHSLYLLYHQVSKFYLFLPSYDGPCMLSSLYFHTSSSPIWSMFVVLHYTSTRSGNAWVASVAFLVARMNKSYLCIMYLLMASD